MKKNSTEFTIEQPQPADAESIVNLLKQSWLDTYVPLGVSDSAINELFSNSTERVSKLTKYLKNMDVNNDIGFVGKVAQSEVRDKYRHTSVKHLFKQGHQSSIVYAGVTK